MARRVAGNPRIRPVLAPNPSPMTYQGTISHLLGSGEVVLLDPGPEIAAHAVALMAALEPGERIVAILASHGHADHVGLAPRMRDLTGAPVLGFGPPGAGRSATMQALVAAGLPDAGEGFSPGYAPDRLIGDGDRLHFGDMEIEVLHTPGHTGCSLSFTLGDVLFPGDLAMGWASSLISPPDGDLGQYRAAMAGLIALDWAEMRPAHGPVVTDVAGRLAALLAHRQTREDEVLAALAAGHDSLPDLTRAIYRDTPAALMPAAERNALAHLIELCARGLARATPLPLPDARFHPA